MCQSYKKTCVCGENTAEIFFGRNILDEKSVVQVYCPRCSGAIEKQDKNRVWDNGWVLELDPDVLQTPCRDHGDSFPGAVGRTGFRSRLCHLGGDNPGRFSTKRPGADGDSIPGQDRSARLSKSYEGVGHNQGEAFYRRRLEEDEKSFLNIFLLIVYSEPGKRISTICR